MVAKLRSYSSVLIEYFFAVILGLFSGVLVLIAGYSHIEAVEWVMGFIYGTVVAGYVLWKGESRWQNLVILVVMSGFSYIAARYFAVTMVMHGLGTTTYVNFLIMFLSGGVGGLLLGIGVLNISRFSLRSLFTYVVTAALLASLWFGSTLIVGWFLDTIVRAETSFPLLFFLWQTGMMVLIAHSLKRWKNPFKHKNRTPAVWCYILLIFIVIAVVAGAVFDAVGDSIQVDDASPLQHTPPLQPGMTCELADDGYNVPCTVGPETGYTCDSVDNCSTKEFVEGCCILGCCS